MAWFTANWFWVLIFIAFIAMHLFGHGGHGGNGGHSSHGRGDRQRGKDERERDGRVVSASSGGHQN
jgi:hypothetical protein